MHITGGLSEMHSHLGMQKGLGHQCTKWSNHSFLPWKGRNGNITHLESPLLKVREAAGAGTLVWEVWQGPRGRCYLSVPKLRPLLVQDNVYS